MVSLSHLYMTAGKTIALTIQTSVSKVMSLLFKTLSVFVIDFLPRSNHLISWLQSQSAVILEHRKKKYVTASTFSPSSFHEVMGPDVMILVFLILSFKLAFSSLHSPSSKGSLVPLCFLSSKWYHLHVKDCWHFSQNLESSLPLI